MTEMGRGDRDRDSEGRPMNARPRDGLGRPLPYGSEGVERVPEGLALPPLESLVEAQRLMDLGRPFHAHEVLEGTWKSAPPDERDLWQGLAQLAVGLTHALRGNTTGAVSVLSRGRDLVAGYADDPPYDIDIAGLLAWSDEVVQRLGAPEHGSNDDLPRLRLRTE
jgi:predicted metal-dependent hydrolase